MKVLISGGYGFFCSHLAERLTREGNRVFILSGENKTFSVAPLCKHTVYDYKAYDLNVRQVFKNVSPDIIIHLGAVEEHQSWNENNVETINFMSGLLNMLMLSVEFDVKKFIFVSSDQVYGAGAKNPLSEGDEAKPASAMGAVMLESENLCQKWEELYRLDCICLRFPSVYGPRESGSDGTVSYMINSVLAGKNVDVLDSREYSLLYVGDAVDAIYRTMGTTVSKIINVAGNEVVTDESLLALVEKICGIKASNKRKIIGESSFVILDNSTAKRELDWAPLYSLESGISNTVQWIKENRKEPFGSIKESTRSKRKKKIRINKAFDRIYPFTENLILFLIIVFISRGWENHPIITVVDFSTLYIIMMAATFGIRQASVAVLLSSGLYIANQVESGFDIAGAMLNLNTLLKIAQFFVIGVAVGYTLDRKRLLLASKDDELVHLHEELHEITRISEDNIRVKRTLEDRLIGYSDSFTKIYTIVAKLDVLEPERVVPAALGVVMEVMQSKNVAIYSGSKESEYFRLVASSFQEAAPMGKSIQLEQLPELEEKLKKQDVFVNRKMIDNMPLMAAPVFSEGKLISVIMIWGMDFERITLYHVNLLRTLAALISSSIGRAYTFAEAVKASKYIEETGILNPQAFHEVLEAKKHAKEVKVSDFVLLEVSHQGDIGDISKRAGNVLRDSDYIGMGDDNKLYVLLSNAVQSDCNIVIDRLKKADVYCTVVNN